MFFGDLESLLADAVGALRIAFFVSSAYRHRQHISGQIHDRRSSFLVVESHRAERVSKY